MAVIELRGVRKDYRAGRGRRVTALDGLDLDVPEGGVFGFLGPNGAGKTTTIRCLLDLARPTAGRCMVLGVDPQVHIDRIQHRVGSLLEDHSLFGGFSARRNLTHLARIARVSHRRVEEVLARVDLEARGDDLVRTFSHGMRQRLGLAAALLKDPEGIVEIRRLLRALAADGRTVFVSSHQLAEVEQLCDHVAVVARGRCVASGPVDGVLASVGTAGVVVRLDDPVAGRAALEAEGIDAWIDEEGLVRIALPSADAPAIARALARHDIYPRELRAGGPSLEEAFLQLTRRDESA